MLKQIKAEQASQLPDDSEDKKIVQKITFEEYEAFLNKLEKENRLDKLELTNPKSVLYQEMVNFSSSNKDNKTK